MTQRSVRKSLAELCSAGIVERVSQGGGRNRKARYRLNSLLITLLFVIPDEGAINEPVTHALEAALPGNSLRALRHVGFTIEELAVVTGTSPRTLVRYAGTPSGRLPMPLSDRLARLARLTLLATRLVGPIEDVLTWMRCKTRALGDVPPLVLLKTDDGTQAVVQSLYSIAYGGVV